MSLARPKGPLADLDEDPADHECEHPSSCPKDPVVRVPRGNELGSSGLTLCPLHLAIWIDDYAGDVNADIEALAERDALLELEDLPSWTTQLNEHWSRLGIDHHGEGHYYRELDSDEDTARVLLVDRHLDAVDIKRVPVNREIADWIQHVRRKRGWLRLDPDARRAHDGGGR